MEIIFKFSFNIVFTFLFIFKRVIFISYTLYYPVIFIITDNSYCQLLVVKKYCIITKLKLISEIH